MPPFTSRIGSAITPRGARSVQRIVDAASRLFGREGFEKASMFDVAQAAGVSKGLLHYHFQSKEHLLIEAQRMLFRMLHRAATDRVRRGEQGLGPALEALDALWAAVVDLRGQTPFLVETMALSTREGPVHDQMQSFYREATELVEDGVRAVFGAQADRLVLPPDRLARMLRIGLTGLVLEVAMARTDADMAAVERSYQDFRGLFERFVLSC